jgi:hypothetical protein
MVAHSHFLKRRWELRCKQPFIDSFRAFPRVGVAGRHYMTWNITSVMDELLAERDGIRKEMTTPEPPEEHVGINVFSAMADGVISESEALAHITALHGTSECLICLDNFHWYRTHKTSPSTCT